ncbi:hypothetical protein B0H34DRAFT_663021 [Crassisporium funariophilum]|nr:hypothetical protein B0H34DRAFT_663021 [Crassisporium funariophilum]
MFDASGDEDPPLFCERKEWGDVVPVEQYEGVVPLAPIFYTEEYKDATNYFRGIVKMNERSLRVLEITEAVIRLNPAHYSAWQYRYETLLTLLPTSSLTPAAPPQTEQAPAPAPAPAPPTQPAPLLTRELTLMDELATKFLKTYQVWHHRRLLLLLSRTPRRELAFIRAGLVQVDAKNYHTWSYRQWVLARFGFGGSKEGDEDLWDGELDFVEEMLVKDVRNNSAWHHRFFVVWGCGVRAGEEDRVRVFKRELTYVKQTISLAPNNPSAWNYLRGILEHNAMPFSLVKAFVLPYTLPLPSPSLSPSTPGTRASVDIVDLETPPPGEGAELPCAGAVEFLADIWEKEGSAEGVGKATELWKALANEHDTIRKKYWEWRIREAHEALKKKN